VDAGADEGRVMSEGLGLAANQVGFDVRVSIARLSIGAADAIGIVPPQFYLLINPTIVDASEEKKRVTEGCLSIPDYRATIERHTWVMLEYHDAEFHRHRVKLTGLDAQVAQHECDHLDGKLIIDGASRQLRRQAERALERYLLKAAKRGAA
jgi:peptide deformylase